MRLLDENAGEIRLLPWPERSEDGGGLHAGLLSFPAALLAGLPAPVRIETVDRAGRVVVIATAPGEAEALRAAGTIAIDGGEWGALASAAESDRVFAADLPVLLALRGPGRVSAEAALAGARPDASRGWTVRTVLDRLGLEPVAFASTRAANAEHGPPEPLRVAA